MSNSSIYTIDKNRLYVISPCLSGSGSNGNEVILYISQKFKVGASPVDGFMSYRGSSVCWSRSSAEMQSVYSTVLANWPVEEKDSEFSQTH